MKRTTKIVRAVPTLALVLGAAAACGEPPPDNGVATVTSPTPRANAAAGGRYDGVKLAQCLRKQGVPAEDPDPAAPAGEGKPYIPESATEQQIDAAMKKCRLFAPDYGKKPPRLDPSQLELLRRFAQCMRAQGVDWSDPDPAGRMGPPGPTSAAEVRRSPPKTGPRPDGPKLAQAMKACDEKVPGSGVTFEGTDGPKGSGPK